MFVCVWVTSKLQSELVGLEEETRNRKYSNLDLEAGWKIVRNLLWVTSYGYLICPQMLDRIKVNSRVWAICGCEHRHELRQWGCAYAPGAKYSADQPVWPDVFLLCVLECTGKGKRRWSPVAIRLRRGWENCPLGRAVLGGAQRWHSTPRVWKHGCDCGLWWWVTHEV